MSYGITYATADGTAVRYNKIYRTQKGAVKVADMITGCWSTNTNAIEAVVFKIEDEKEIPVYRNGYTDNGTRYFQSL